MIFERIDYFWTGHQTFFSHLWLNTLFNVPESATWLQFKVFKKPGPDRREIEVGKCSICNLTMLANVDFGICLDVKIEPGTYYLECWYE